MIRLLTRKMPGQASRYRLLFQVASDVRGHEHYIEGTVADLQAFLSGKLDMPLSAANKLANKSEFTGSAYTELALLGAEIKLILRGIAAETTIAPEQSRQSRGKTVPVVA